MRSSIPTGLNHTAQGCDSYPGSPNKRTIQTLKGVESNRSIPTESNHLCGIDHKRLTSPELAACEPQQTPVNRASSRDRLPQTFQPAGMRLNLQSVSLLLIDFPIISCSNFLLNKSPKFVIRVSIPTLLLLAVLNSFSAASYEVWHPRNVGLTLSDLNGVAYGNGRFVTVGSAGAIFISTNGIDWQSRPLGTNILLSTVSFLQGQFFVGGSGGTILYSADCDRWTNAIVPTTNEVAAFGFGRRNNDPAGTYVAAAWKASFGADRGSLILTSTNGASWDLNYRYDSSSNRPVGGRLNSVAAGNDRFVMGGASDTFATTVFSDRANEWFHAFGLQIGPVLFTNNLFLIAHNFLHSSGGLSVSSATSATGDFWNGPGVPSGSVNVSRAICFGIDRFVLVGDRGAVGASLDGTNWTARLIDADVDFRAVAYGASVYVAVGQAGLIMTSEDGLNWTDRSRRIHRHLNGVAPDGDGFIAVGPGGTIATSQDGVDWEATKASVTNRLMGVLRVGDNYIMAGASGAILTGTNIQQMELQTSGSTLDLNGVAYGKGTYAVVGNSGTILTSLDTVNWTPRMSNITNDLYDVVYGGGAFVAVGLRGAIVSSLDGLVWEKRDSGTTRSLYRLTYGQGRFIVGCYAGGGNDAFVLTSLDGITFSAPLTRILASHAPAYGNGVFLLTSANAPYVHPSMDGLVWGDIYLPTTAPITVIIGDLAFNNGTFVAVSSRGQIWQSDPIVHLSASHDGTMQLTVQGPKNSAYRIEANDALGTTNSWQELTTLSTPPSTWTDSTSSQHSNRVYRAVLLPPIGE